MCLQIFIRAQICCKIQIRQMQEYETDSYCSEHSINELLEDPSINQLTGPLKFPFELEQDSLSSNGCNSDSSSLAIPYEVPQRFKPVSDSSDSVSSQAQEEDICSDVQEGCFIHDWCFIVQKVQKSLDTSITCRQKYGQRKDFLATSMIDNHLTLSNHPEECIGILRCQWRSSHNRIVALSTGSAFLIAPDLLMTCAHNLYSHRKGMASQIMFLPQHQTGLVKGKHYYARLPKALKMEKNVPYLRLTNLPLREQMVLVRLQQPCLRKQYLKILVDFDQPGQQLKISGYPNNDTSNKLILSHCKIKREDLQGQLKKVQGHMVIHNLQTRVGHSGSPILCHYISNGGLKLGVCGIHTHCYHDRWNREGFIRAGVFFDHKQAETLKGYIRELSEGQKQTERSPSQIESMFVRKAALLQPF